MHCIQPLKSTYEVLIQDLKKVHEVYYHGRGGTDFSWERKMTELVTNIIEFMAAKRDMTELYPNLNTSCKLEHIMYPIVQSVEIAALHGNFG
jgi:hypothetical protein